MFFWRILFWLLFTALFLFRKIKENIFYFYAFWTHKNVYAFKCGLLRRPKSEQAEKDLLRLRKMMNVWETFHFIYKEWLYEWFLSKPLSILSTKTLCISKTYVNFFFLLALMCFCTFFGEPWMSVFSVQGYVLLPILTWWLQLWLGWDTVWFSQFVLKCTSCFCVIFEIPMPTYL